MILKSIDMQGFKSFPDKISLELGKGITGVVGPNGSGKSNISDAVRWVLGEQSTKALRGAKMEDVIFGGTSKRKALGYAEVTLHLDNTDRSLAKDADSVSVTRRYFRSGESEYKVNGEVCRLRDIHELFMDTGLGRDGYSMVSQGKIADLVSAKSTQRRDMLEEASGISHYRYRRADANKKLEQAEENLVRLRDILVDLESRIGPLKVQSEKAIKFLALSDEKKVLEIGLWMHAIEKAGNDLRGMENKLSIAVAQRDEVEGNLLELEEKIEQAIQLGQQFTVDIERFNRTSSELEEKAAVTEGQIAVLKSTIEHNKSTIERIITEMGDSEKSVAEIEDEINKAKDAIKVKEAKIEEIRTELAEELKRLNELLSQNGENSEKSRETNSKIADATLKLSDIRVGKSTASSTAEELKTRIVAIDDAISSRDYIISAIEDEKKKAESEINRIQAEIDENNNSADGYRLIIETREGKAEKFRGEIDQLNLDIYQKNARIKMLDDLEKNLDGYSGSVQKVIKEAKRGAMRGIHGTLSQLISTNKEYSVAVETALGAAIQNIVVDDENSAKRAIEFLKNNRAGRATFLPLTSVKSRDFNEKGFEKCDGYVSIACDVVECDAKYKEIINNLLGRTVLVDNIDNGIDMAKKYSYRFKIVTLDGQVLNAGGSITGGSRGSGSGLLSRINEIEELKSKVDSLSKELSEKESQYKEIASEIEAAQAKLEAGDADLIRLQESKIRAESDLKLSEDRLAAANGQIGELNEEKETAKARIAAAEKAVDEADSEIESIQTEIEKLNKELNELDSEREKLDALREKSSEYQNELNIQIVALNKEIEANQEIISVDEIRKTNIFDKSGRLEEEIESLKQNNISLTEEIQKLTKEAEDSRQEVKDIAVNIETLAQRRTETEAESAELRKKDRELTDDKEKLSGEVARLEERKENLERDLENTKNKLFDEYQLTYREAKEVGEIPEDIPKAQRSLQEIKNKIRALGSVNVGAVEEYKEVSERYEYMSSQLNDIEKSKAELEKLINELTGKMAERFREQFRRINNAFGETFQELFGGGKAELVLEDPQDVLECNINIKVQPPGKNVQNIDLLSGGEKGLAAIALLFAILKITPAPFCIFDEVEAALDDVNVSRYAQYVRNMTAGTQFILITHRRGTMEEADILYGVTMQEEGVSKILELKSAEMAKKFSLE